MSSSAATAPIPGRIGLSTVFEYMARIISEFMPTPDQGASETDSITVDATNWDPKEWFHADSCIAEFGLESTSSLNEEALSTSDALLASLDHCYQKTIKQRIEELTELAEEEAPETEPLSLKSLQDFIRFMGCSPKYNKPNLVLTHEGNIRAKWKKQEKSHYIAIEFSGESTIKFVVSVSDPSHSYRTIRASGVATIDSVMKILEPYGTGYMYVS